MFAIRIISVNKIPRSVINQAYDTTGGMVMMMMMRIDTISNILMLIAIGQSDDIISMIKFRLHDNITPNLVG
jgi:hypothetical protein